MKTILQAILIEEWPLKYDFGNYKEFVTFHILGVPVEMIKARKISGIFMIFVVGRFL